MELSRRSFLGGALITGAAISTGALGSLSLPSKVPLARVDDGYINPLWKQMVNIQDFKDNRVGMLYSLDYKFEPEASEGIGGEPIRRMRLEVISHPIGDESFIYDESTIGQAVKETVMSFPKPYLKHNEDDPNYTVFEVRANCNMVAKDTRRGKANRNLYDSWYYSGMNGIADGGFAVVSRTIGGKKQYAIWKSERFDDYGFSLDAPVHTLMQSGTAMEYHVHTSYYTDTDQITHMPLTTVQDKVRIITDNFGK